MAVGKIHTLLPQGLPTEDDTSPIEEIQSNCNNRSVGRLLKK